jgi:hypothetical protein
MLVSVWTIQPITVWEQLMADGVARVNPRLTSSGQTIWQYRWLVGQLASRNAQFDGNLPWWFYCGKPDLRFHRWNLPKGWHVRLELRLEVERVVIFPIEEWDVVFSGRLLETPERSQAFFTDLKLHNIDLEERPYPEPWQRIVERSWEQLFKTRALYSEMLTSDYEGVVQELRAGDVRQVTKVLGHWDFV